MKRKEKTKSEYTKDGRAKNGSRANGKNGSTGVINVKFLAVIWAFVLVLSVSTYFVSRSFPEYGARESIMLVTAIVSFASFIMTSLFSFLLFSHNAMARDTTKEMRKINDEINARNEEFKTLQFVAANYTMIELVDHMLLYEEYPQYIKRLRAQRDYTYYMRESDVDLDHLEENFDEYKFVTARIPISIVEGKAISKIRFSRFKLSKEEKEHRFLPACASCQCLIIFNEKDKRNELVVNLIMKKDSEFFIEGEIDIFSRIRINLTVQSLLGVVITGWTELYFSNPTKQEKYGANKYKIESSYFEISGLPTLITSVDKAIRHKD
ncbi:MAG: hypothetical protein FWB72_04390 [Firmicutes bacterium]|nr:hypothetical protein [Bacillota bacterium]